MILPRRIHRANGPHLIKAAFALLVAAACFALLVYLLTPVGPQAQGIGPPPSDFITVRPVQFRPPPLLRA